MNGTIVSNTLAVAAFVMMATTSLAQSTPGTALQKPIIEKQVKPFKILTSGKRITIQSKNSANFIKRILVWTSTGHRIVEQHDLEVTSYGFLIPVDDKIFFLMLEMNNGKRYTDKFGVQ